MSKSLDNDTDSIEVFPNQLLNKNIYAMGLSPLQLTLMFFITGICFLINIYLGVIILGPMYLIGQRINTENKNGDPDYLNGLIKSLGDKIKYYEGRKGSKLK